MQSANRHSKRRANSDGGLRPTYGSPASAEPESEATEAMQSVNMPSRSRSYSNEDPRPASSSPTPVDPDPEMTGPPKPSDDVTEAAASVEDAAVVARKSCSAIKDISD